MGEQFLYNNPTVNGGFLHKKAGIILIPCFGVKKSFDIKALMIHRALSCGCESRPGTIFSH
jgi:hypothetical protein